MALRKRGIQVEVDARLKAHELVPGKLAVLHDLQPTQVSDVRFPDNMGPGLRHQRHRTELGDDVLAPERLGKNTDVEVAPTQIDRLHLREHRNPIGHIPCGVAEGRERFGEALLHEADSVERALSDEVEDVVYDRGLPRLCAVLGHRRVQHATRRQPGSRRFVDQTVGAGREAVDNERLCARIGHEPHDLFCDGARIGRLDDRDIK